MMNKLLLGCAMTALTASSAYAQSTGAIDFDHSEIVVTGSKTDKGVAGVMTPDTPKAKAVLTQQFISHQVSGQSIDDVINMLPGVSFQNNDPYGSSGGTLTIRGFDASRISQTFDGVALNDTGNYAIYSNQQLDPELIEQVNVNLGTTDIDSPSASASGSTVNYRTRLPTDDFHVQIKGSTGEYGFFRLFGVVDTGEFTPWGTKAFLEASHSENYNPYNHNAVIDKQQYNARVYQPIGSNGDFISIAGNYNKNVNNNFSSVPLRVDTVQSPTNPAVRVVGSAASNRFPTFKDEREYTPAACRVAAVTPGTAGTTNTCGTLFDYSFNPSNTGNIRVNSKFTLADGLVLTVDPNYQYVKANGGSGAVKGNEGFYTRTGTATVTGIGPLVGYVGGQPYFGGIDLNGDGDTKDAVEVYAPSHTGTHRYGVVASLRYDISQTQTVRVSYTLDHGRHRQTGPVALLQDGGYTTNVFPIDKPLLDANGNVMMKRNRLSYAILNEVSGEYRGEFFDSKLVVNAGARAPFFKRELNNFCVTEAGGTFSDCFNGNPTAQATFLAANPTYVAPLSRTFKYNKVLPSAGVTYQLVSKFSLFASYSKGLQVPGTDNLYQSLGFAAGAAQPKPETTDNFDAGWRYRSSKLQAQVAGWYTLFNNRLASAYDPVQDITLYRNLGKVKKYGVDADVSYQLIPEISLYAFGSYLKSKIEDNVELAKTAAGTPVYALTAGKRESGAPVYTFGGRIEGNYGPLQVAVQGKRTGARYVNDQNLPITQCTASLVAAACPSSAISYQVYGAKAKAYTTVDLDARLSLAFLGLNDRTFLQLNVTNLFDKLYVSGFTGGLAATNIPFAYVGPPRTFSGTLAVGF